MKVEKSGSVEKLFLDNVVNPEKHYVSGKLVSVYELLGKPDHVPAHNIQGGALKQACTKLITLLADHHIYIDMLSSYKDGDLRLYTFITEELFQQSIEYSDEPGWSFTYVYEEFHPNHSLDIEVRVNDLVRYLFNGAFPGAIRYDEQVLHDSCLQNVSVIGKEGMQTGRQNAEITRFFEQYNSRTLIDHQIDRLDIMDNAAVVHFYITFKTLSQGIEKRFHGIGKITLAYNSRWWDITGLDMPGLTI
ncbi:MAG: hypothetical protein R2794_11760 [Chitinophagales bacterium]